MKEIFYGCYYLSSVSESSNNMYININNNLINFPQEPNEKEENNLLNNTEHSQLNELYNENNISSFDKYSIIDKNNNISNFCDKNDNEIKNLLKRTIYIFRIN